VTIGPREFFHILLKRYAEELGLQWPEDLQPDQLWDCKNS
jgi:hypothetical protein